MPRNLLITISWDRHGWNCTPIFLTIPEAKDLFAGIPPNTIKQQNDISQHWLATNWNGICEDLTKVSSPTLIITGTHDNNVPIANSLIIGQKSLELGLYR